MNRYENMKVSNVNAKTVTTGKRYATVFAPLKSRSIASGYKGNYEWWNVTPDAYNDESYIEDDEGVKLRLKTFRKTDHTLPFDDYLNY